MTSETAQAIAEALDKQRKMFVRNLLAKAKKHKDKGEVDKYWTIVNCARLIRRKD